MNKGLLIKYFRGEATEAEIDKILSWVNQSEHNKNYFAHTKAIWDLSGEKLITSTLENKPRQKGKNIFRVLYFTSAAVIIVLLSINLFLKQEAKTDITVVESTIAPVKNIADNIVTIYTNKGVKGKIVLPDSSTVWMNSDSKISYPVNFENNKRNVSMSGEVYFEVRKDSLRPMYVTTNKNLTIKVLGTAFSIKSYNNDNESKTTLFNGAITLHYKNKESKNEKTVNIKPLESITCNDINVRPILTKPKDITKEIAWKDGNLIFDNTPMDEAIKMLERWYGTTFIVNNNNIYNYKLTSTFRSESITQVLDMMKYCMPLKFEIKNNLIILN